ncbi:hypothetical protein FNU76_01985 [Chitinimonas arctica]|uniref:Putative cytidine deaminase C-terminal domain-containing protein n=1 Tax=Chitinimonas arctica TaxID=2594795 RepID=A0A516SAN7_9NEIS|nr:hypothetical protein [Chitinimonas arctica]QDQ25217.1 hypothetical protein FNU76_01985 [Chitinimonas arctica]
MDLPNISYKVAPLDNTTSYANLPLADQKLSSTDTLGSIERGQKDNNFGETLRNLTQKDRTSGVHSQKKEKPTNGVRNQKKQNGSVAYDHLGLAGTGSAKTSDARRGRDDASVEALRQAGAAVRAQREALRAQRPVSLPAASQSSRPALPLAASQMEIDNPVVNEFLGIPALRGAASITMGVDEDGRSLLKCEAVLLYNGKKYYDVNQRARNSTLATDEKLSIYSEAKEKAERPNNTWATAHAEIGAMEQAYKTGQRGGAPVIYIIGKPVCGYCQSDIKKMALKLGLSGLTVVHPDGVVEFTDPEDFSRSGAQWKV